MRYRKLFLVLGFLIGGQSVLAADGMTANLALFYMTDNSDRSFLDNAEQAYSVKIKTNYTFKALGVCYRYEVFCFGLKYQQGSIEKRSSNSSDGSSLISAQTYHAPGLTLGYSGAELMAHITFLVSAEKKLSQQLESRGGNSTSSDTSYPAKAARSIDLGYGFKLGSLRVGPLLSILHMEYTSKRNGGETAALPAKEADDFILPHFALWMDF